MKTIWKYDLILGTTILELPEKAQILSVGTQSTVPGTCCLWALVDPDAPREKRIIEVCGTGMECADVPMIFIGRATQGPFEWHVFEMKPSGFESFGDQR